MDRDIIRQLNSLQENVASLQSQISSLKQQSSGVASDFNGCKLITCTVDTDLIFDRYDVVKIVEGIAKKFDGTERSSDNYLHGIIVEGNNNSDNDAPNTTVVAMISGTHYVFVHDATIPEVGANLYVSSDDYFQVTATPSGYVLFTCVEVPVTGKLVKVEISARSSSGSGSGVYPAKIVSKDGAFYRVNVYANGFDQAATLTNVLAQLLMLNYADTMPVGTEVLVAENYIDITSGGEV